MSVRHAQRGAALLLAIVAVALLSLASVSLLGEGAQLMRREAEDELLRVGQDWQRALRSYIDSTPGQAALGPPELEHLLLDPRLPSARRHLRRIPIDPITGASEWGVIRGPQGQIVGVHSLSREPIVRRTGFPEWLDQRGSVAHEDWVFAPRRFLLGTDVDRRTH
ncbi:MAG: type II secretion system protein [Rubrivivax sp.]|nr:type II secretion system protein [Rubrivivax sp.]